MDVRRSGASPEGVEVYVDSDQVSKWERGEKYPSDRYRRLYCVLHAATERDLGLAPPGLPGPGYDGTAGEALPLRVVPDVAYRLAVRAIDPEEEDSVKRREFLKGAAAFAIVPDLPSLREERVIDELESMTRDLARRSRIIPPLLVGQVQGHLQTFKRGLRSALSSRRLYSAAGNAAVLTGRLSQYLDDWGESHQALSWAESLARESGDGTLMAHALGVLSSLHSGIPRGGRGGNPDRSVEILDAAISAGTSAPPQMRAWLHARRAEEHAIAGRALAARGDLEQAAQALAGAARVDDGFFWHISEAWLAGYQGNCERLLQQPRPAVDFLESALAAISPDQTGSRSGVLADLAAAHAMAGDGDQAADLLMDSLVLASRSGVRIARERIVGVRRSELAGCDTSVTRELDALLASAR